jgi:preprotein translocase subunit Sec63
MIEVGMIISSIAAAAVINSRWQKPTKAVIILTIALIQVFVALYGLSESIQVSLYSKHEISRSLSVPEIKRHFRSLSRQLHPDKRMSETNAEQEYV